LKYEIRHRSASSRVIIAAALSCLAISTASCDSQNAPKTSETPAAPPAQTQTALPASSEAPVTAVDSVMITRPQDAPDAVVIAVNGTVNSAGWTDPKLLPVNDTAAEPSIRSYRFVATTPASADVMQTSQPVEALLRIDALPAGVSKIRIVAAENEVSADMGSVQ